ncbi:hypothetical protein MKW92_052372 [Papaver armeniacum]|nr:hypothetical protein MKW92_052372 [Papaver armeniacum]
MASQNNNFSFAVLFSLIWDCGCNRFPTNRTVHVSSDQFCRTCPVEVEELCRQQGRLVSTIEESVCEGCCGKPSPAPPRPISSIECQAGEIDTSFPLYGCKNKCERESKCLPTGQATVSREMCTHMAYWGQSIFVCNCCCRKTGAY